MVDELKTCSKCGRELQLSEFRAYKKSSGSEHIKGTCKLCEKEYDKKYCKEHKEERNERDKKYYKEHLKEMKERNKKYYKEHIEEAKEWEKKYRKTSEGRESVHRHGLKRKYLGYAPINNPVFGYHYHHFRHLPLVGEDADIGIYIPEQVHKAIPHNGWTGKNITKVNFMTLDWYMDNTPAEKVPEKLKALHMFCALSL
jgi:hypothetical protein